MGICEVNLVVTGYTNLEKPRLPIGSYSSTQEVHMSNICKRETEAHTTVSSILICMEWKAEHDA